MKINKEIKVPTGSIYTAIGEKGKMLEFLTVGDYGKNANIKADFLGITRELEGVPNGVIMPLTEKWVITLSTQYGCSMNCKFCDVPKVGMGINVTLDDLRNQVLSAIISHPEITHTKRLNIHYARMGEPTWNDDVIRHAECYIRRDIKPYLGDSLVHPVISTMMPNKNNKLFDFLQDWVWIKNVVYNGDAGLQFSINSTDDKQREYLFSGNALTIKEISNMVDKLPMPIGRKYALNFALADNSIIDADRLAGMFDSNKCMCKLTPLHKTNSCSENHIQTTGGYDTFTPYKDIEDRLKRHGFDVIVFVPSYDEDNSLITCGNAVLSGKTPTSKFDVIEY